MSDNKITKKYYKFSETSPLMQNSTLNLFIFLLFLFLILLHQNGIFESETKKQQHIEESIDFTGIECAFQYKTKKIVKIWAKSYITIMYKPSSNCSTELLSQLQKDGGATFRIQAYSVYEMTAGTSVYVGNNTYQVELLLSFPTKYIVMVMLTYVNGQALESRMHARPLLKQLEGSPFQLNVIRSPSPKGLSRYCSKRESGIATGRWIKCGGAINGLERCGAWQAPDFDFDRIHGFRWVPYLCQYHQYTNDQMKKCFAKNRWSSIVFAGDSHMRYRAYHWATRLYGSCHACAKTHIKMVFDKIPRIEWVFDARGTR